MFALVDCNNFYASCERVFQPQLRQKPIVVLSNNDGCVIARSNEAKDLGVPMGAPAFKYQALFDQHQVHVFSSNFALYGDMSTRVMSILGEYTPLMEVYSIDEAFLDFTGFTEFHNLQSIGVEMHKRVTQSTGIPISIGFAPTKALAKVANRIAKKFPDRTGGVYIIDTPQKLQKAIQWLKIEDVWGIGRQHSNRLKMINVHTAYDFIQVSDHWVRKYMTVVGLRLKKELQGIRTLELEEQAQKQSITCSRTFEADQRDYEYIKERIVTFATVCARKLREQESHCNMVSVFLMTNAFKQDSPQYYKNSVLQLPFPTNSSIEIAKFCTQALEKIYRSEYAYKKAGVLVMELTPANNAQLQIFKNTDRRHSELFAVVDRLNKALGAQKIKLAAQDLGRTWKMRQERMSRRYTTRIDEIIEINCRN